MSLLFAFFEVEAVESTVFSYTSLFDVSNLCLRL